MFLIAGLDLCHLKSCVIEASLSGVDWHAIDRRESSTDLRGLSMRTITRTFFIVYAGELQMARPRQIGENHRGCDDSVLSVFEVFGDLIYPTSGRTRYIALAWPNQRPVLPSRACIIWTHTHVYASRGWCTENQGRTLT